MAEIKGGILGKVKGKLGNKVYRIMNGKQFTSERPDKYKPTKSKALKSARGKFGLTVSFAKFVNSIPALKKIWTVAKISGANSYQKLIKNNAKFTTEGCLTAKNLISPPGIPFCIGDLSLNKNIISFSIDLTGTKISPLIANPFRVYSIIYFYDSKNKKDEPAAFSHNISGILPAAAAEIYPVNFKLDNKQSLIAGKYKKRIIYFALVSEEVNKKGFWTSTFAASLD